MDTHKTQEVVLEREETVNLDERKQFCHSLYLVEVYIEEVLLGFLPHERFQDKSVCSLLFYCACYPFKDPFVLV